MIFRDLLEHFAIEESFPDYLLNQTFNKVFLDGKLTNEGNCYKIVITTRQDVTHQMFIRPDDEYPVAVLSRLPNGSLNGMKFGRTSDDEVFINHL